MAVQFVKYHSREVGYEIDVPPEAVTLSSSFGSTSEKGDSYLKTSINIILSVSGGKSLSNVSFASITPSNIHVHPKNVHILKLNQSNSKQNTIKMDFYALKAILPGHNTVQIIATFTLSNGEVQTKNILFDLPIVLSCRIKAATKNANYKLVIDTNGREAIPLTELFDDFLLQNTEFGIDVVEILGASASHAMGFQFW